MLRHLQLTKTLNGSPFVVGALGRLDKQYCSQQITEAHNMSEAHKLNYFELNVQIYVG